MSIFSTSISITPSQEQPLLSKTQKMFNNLIGKIENKRAQLQAWEIAMPRYQQQYTGELIPLVEASLDLQVEMVHRLNHISGQKGLTKTELCMIAELIRELASELIADRNNEELKAIYNKHSGSDYDSEEAAGLEGVKSMMEEMFGVDLDDVDLKSSPDEMMKKMQTKMEEMRTAHNADQQAQAERQAKRKKSAKQIAKEQAQQAEEQQISQSIREVYRKLASALHPDRETDPEERERKTALIQRVNQAYDKKNLLQLLELQLEIEHIDLASMKNISEERLAGYNKILKEQLRELDEEIFHVENDFRMRCNISPFARLSPSTLSSSIAKDMAGIRQAMRDLEKDLFALQDIKMTKAWLKKMRQQPRQDFFGDMF